MLQDFVFILLGLVGLYFGAEWLVKGSSRLAQTFGISTLVIGLTVVAFGTSMPELLVSLTAALDGTPELAVGNVVGSNIANIGLILGVAGMMTTVMISLRLVRVEIPAMIISAFIVYLMMQDGEIGRLEGGILVFGMIFFTATLYLLAMREADAPARLHEEGEEKVAEAKNINRGRELLRLLVGIAVLVVGANLLVDGAKGVASELGVSEAVIGFTLVAFGTSLPELATAVVAAMQDETDILVGNVIGSNIANLLLILGTVALVKPIPIDDSILSFEMLVMLGFSVVFFVPFAFDLKIRRREALIFLGAYAAFSVVLFVR
jgi:cation:H+ antiporter